MCGLDVDWDALKLADPCVHALCMRHSQGEKYTGALGDFALEMKKMSPRKSKKSPWKSP